MLCITHIFIGPGWNISSTLGPLGTYGGSWLVESDHVTRGWRHIISGVGNRWPVDKKDRGLMEPEVTWFRRGNRWPVEKMDRGLKGKENRGENAGSKSKVQFGEEGWPIYDFDLAQVG